MRIVHKNSMQLNSQYIGNFIKSMRKRSGLTQHELAERIGVGNKAVSKWEQGRGIPDISLLYQLSLVLDMDIESILAGNLGDLGKEWIGIIHAGDAPNGCISGRQDLEYFISMFLLVGIRDIAVISLEKRSSEDEDQLKEYKEKSFLRQTWCCGSFEEFTRVAELEKKHICLLYRPAFLYGMHLTRYMRRAMLREKPTILALRQGEDSFMSPICYNGSFLCISSKADELPDMKWRMFPMIFGSWKQMTGCLKLMENAEDQTIDADALRDCFKEVYVEPMERGMLAFLLQSEDNRELAEQVLSGIEKSQHIRIGNLEEIMAVRGWK